MKRKRFKKNQGGNVMLLALCFMFLLGIVSLAFVYTTVNLNIQSQHSLISKQAFYLADAGIEQASWKLWNRFKDCGMTANKMTTFSNDVTTAYNNYVDTNTYYVTLTTMGNGDYRAYIQLISTDSTQTTVRITSVGRSFINKNNNTYTERKIVADVKYYLAGTGLMDFAYFANNFAWHTGAIKNGGSMGTNGWMNLSGPYIAGGDRYKECKNYDLIQKLDDGGLFASKNLTSGSTFNGYNDIYPKTPNRYEASNFEGIEMPTLAGAYYYESTAKSLQTAAGSGKYGIYYYVSGGTTLYRNNGTTVDRTVANGGEYIKVSDAVYGDDPTGNNTETGYYYQDGKWKKGEKQNIVLKGGTADKPLQIYGTVVVRGNVVMGNNVIDGSGAIFSGNNIYAAGKIEYKDKPSVTASGGVSDTMTGYRGFTDTRDSDNSHPSSGDGRTALTTAETNQETWLNANKPESADVSGGKDLLGLFATGSVCLGNIGGSTSSDRNNLGSSLTQNGSITVKTNQSGTTTTTESVNFNESDEAELGKDRVPNTRTSKYQTGGNYVDPEYKYETNGLWDVSFYTAGNPPPRDPNSSSQYAINPATGNRFEILTDSFPTGAYSSWSSNQKNSVIPGSGEDLDGDGVYDPTITVADAAAFDANSAAKINAGTLTWDNATKFDPNNWGGTVDVKNTSNDTLSDVSSPVTRLDALTYTNHVWGGTLSGPANGTLLTRIESTAVTSTDGCPINHDDRITAGGQSLSSTNIMVPMIEHMEIVAWKE